MNKRHHGFTLMELMVGLMIVAIAISLAAPSFVATIENNRLTTGINEFITALNLARSESVKRGKRVSVCKSSDGNTCAGGGFEDGWIVFEDDSGFGAHAADEELIKIHEEFEDGYTLRGSANYTNFISFLPSGRVTATGDFSLCVDSDLTKSRSINILITGRVRLDKAGASNCY